MKTSTRAFTLVELSVVVIIIGLLAGGILVGQDLLKNARLGNVMNETAKYSSALQQFQQKYMALPGDFSTATSVWADSGGSVTCAWGNSTGIVTCNGDGNGQIADQTNFASYAYESHRAWQQLAFAGLIEGGYNGGFDQANIASTTAGAVVVTPGTRVPRSAYRGDIGWHLYYVGLKSNDATFFNGNYGHVLYLGRGAYAVSAANKGLMLSEDMIALENKFDDGIPSVGKIRSGQAAGVFGGTCVSSATAYATGQTACIPLFLTGL